MLLKERKGIDRYFMTHRTNFTVESRNSHPRGGSGGRWGTGGPGNLRKGNRTAVTLYNDFFLSKGAV